MNGGDADTMFVKIFLEIVDLVEEPIAVPLQEARERRWNRATRWRRRPGVRVDAGDEEE